MRLVVKNDALAGGIFRVNVGGVLVFLLNRAGFGTARLALLFFRRDRRAFGLFLLALGGKRLEHASRSLLPGVDVRVDRRGAP